MIYLLDTHVFLWLDAEPAKLSETVTAIVKNPANLLFLSYVSVWEMQVKQQIGKLKLRVPLIDRLLIAQANYEDIATLTVDPQVAKYPVKAIW